MKKIRPVGIILLVGLLLGVIWTNFTENNALKMNAISDITLLHRYLQKGVEGWDYFRYLLQYQGIGYLLGAVFGISIFGIPMSILWVGAMGFYIGSVLSASLISGGIWGLAAGFGMLLPQSLIYIPVTILLFDSAWKMSRRCWRNQHFTVKLYQAYIFKMVILLLLLVLGFLMESFINPILLKMLLNKINFF